MQFSKGKVSGNDIEKDKILKVLQYLLCLFNFGQTMTSWTKMLKGLKHGRICCFGEFSSVTRSVQFVKGKCLKLTLNCQKTFFAFSVQFTRGFVLCSYTINSTTENE